MSKQQELQPPAETFGGMAGQEGKSGRGIDGFSLKLLAMAAMFLDHVGAAVLEPMVSSGKLSEDGMILAMKADVFLRTLGRLAFPIFCFLLVEGFFHTKSRKAYLLRMGVFAIVSEIPFDLAFSGRLIAMDHQNVFFTLFFGLASMTGLWVFDNEVMPYVKRGKQINQVVGRFCIMALGFLTATFFKTDYAGFGVFAMLLLYWFYGRKRYQTAVGAIYFLLWGGMESAAAAAFLPIGFYNGKRGRQVKYLFYWFYPIHLLALSLLGLFLIQNL